MLDAQTAATTSAIALPRGETARFTVVLQSTGTTSGGTVIIEEAYYDPNGPTYAGTWSQLQSVAASSFTGGAQIAYHFTGSFWAVRVRISADITGGGSVSAFAWGN